MSKIKELEELGFEKVGEWYKDNNEKTKYNLNKYNKERVIYAFTNKKEILYIGICDANQTGLKKRLDRYKNKQGNGTNKRIIENISKTISKKEEQINIYIYVLKPTVTLHYNNIEIDLIRGLEYSLIKKFNPNWNKAGK